MQAPLMISQFQEFIIDVSGSSESAWTILGSALLPSLNSSKVSLSSLFLSIWSNIFSTRFCGVFSSSAFDCWPCEKKLGIICRKLQHGDSQFLWILTPLLSMNLVDRSWCCALWGDELSIWVGLVLSVTNIGTWLNDFSTDWKYKIIIFDSLRTLCIRILILASPSSNDVHRLCINTLNQSLPLFLFTT